jgi:actin-related protein
VIAGAIDWNHVRRINWGGAVASEFLHRLLALKYPALMTAANPNRLTPLHTQWLLHRCGVVAGDGASGYGRAMAALGEDVGLERMDLRIQLAGTAATEATRRREAAETQKLAERAAAALREKRRMLAERLRAQSAEQRVQTLRSKEHIVVTLRGLMDAVHAAFGRVQRRAPEPEQDDEGASAVAFSDADEPAGSELSVGTPRDSQATGDNLPLSLATLGDARLVGELGRFGYRRLGALEAGLREAEEDLLRFQASCSANGISIDSTVVVSSSVPVEAPDYSLLDVADGSLTEEQVREKRRLRLLKNSADARERMRQERLVAAEAEAAVTAALEALRVRDVDEWRATLYGRRTALLTRILARQKRRADRRGQQDARLRSVVALGADQADEAGATGNMPDAGPDDGFGMNDDDWLVYRGLSREDDDERDAQDQAALVAVEELLETRDGDEFFRRLQAEQDAARTLIDRLLRGPGAAVSDEDGNVNGNVNGGGNGEAVSNAIHINAERMRCTEALFQPAAIMGIDQAGLAEVLTHLFAAYPCDIQARLARAVVLSGGSAALPGLSARLTAELRAMLPVTVDEVVVSVAAETTAVWRGARELCLRHPAAIPWISRETYESVGAVVDGPAISSAFSNPY